MVIHKNTKKSWSIFPLSQIFSKVLLQIGVLLQYWRCTLCLFHIFVITLPPLGCLRPWQMVHYHLVEEFLLTFQVYHLSAVFRTHQGYGNWKKIKIWNLTLGSRGGTRIGHFFRSKGMGHFFGPRMLTAPRDLLPEICTRRNFFSWFLRTEKLDIYFFSRGSNIGNWSGN